LTEAKKGENNMRKSNSNFLTSFVSEAGSGVVNNDFFGFVELAEYACYVIADGLYDDAFNAESARMAIEMVVQKFQEHPSMRKSVIHGYLSAANKYLLVNEKRGMSLKASITVLVTNYEAIRYASVGNTRLYLYRGSEVLHQSSDTSLAQRFADREDYSQDIIAQHEERNNLYTYLGQSEGISPFISPKIKLKDSDIITLFTRGIWENVDEGELFDVFTETSDDPQESVDTVEELLLSRQPQQLSNYTIAAIFINKIFQDPNRRKKRKRIIIISIIVFVVIVAIVVILILYNRDKRNKREEMDEATINTVFYIENDNYNKASENADIAYKLAKKLKDKEKIEELDAYIKLIDAVIQAEGLLEQGDYQAAQDAYIIALGFTIPVNGAGKEYINNRLDMTEKYMNFYGIFELGDALSELGEYEMAIEKYTEAKNVASGLFFVDGKQQAIDAIAAAYAKIAENNAAEKEAQAETAAAEKAESDAAREAAATEADATKSASELLAQGDTLYAQGDLEGAKTYYRLAKEKFAALNDANSVAIANSKISLVDKKIAANAEQEALADEYALKADAFFAEQNYDDAKKYYTMAKQLYNSLKLELRVAQMDNKLAEIEYAQKKEGTGTGSENTSILSTKELMDLGDLHYEKGEFKTARTYYQLAKEKYEDAKDESGLAVADSKIALTDRKIADLAAQEANADEYAKKADAFFAEKNFTEAKNNYTMARELYRALKLTLRVTAMDAKLVEVEAAAEKAATETTPAPIIPETSAPVQMTLSNNGSVKKQESATSQTTNASFSILLTTLVSQYEKMAYELQSRGDFETAALYGLITKQLSDNRNQVSSNVTIRQPSSVVIPLPSRQNAEKTFAAINLLLRGDYYFEKGDSFTAQTFYQIAKEYFDAVGDINGSAYCEEKGKLCEGLINATAA